jgi:aryl-alcohol dehydrogenase-like predicted oxidoreductase
MLGWALRDDLCHRREELGVATNGGLSLTDEGLRRNSGPAWLRKGVEESLRALGVDHIDLYHIHCRTLGPGRRIAASVSALDQVGAAPVHRGDCL